LLNNYAGEWKAAPIKEAFSEFVNSRAWGFGLVMNAFRICLVGAAMGPDLFEICEMIGKTETLKRIGNGIENIN
ncbi:MAG: glutamate--tRNA ligase, partial [Prolixibacteraceae bacterium]|nr:glutamate--tRNA ligase [Prolixibacteraceae bacterium]